MGGLLRSDALVFKKEPYLEGIEPLTPFPPQQMVNYRMARKPLQYLALWISAASLANANSPSLPSDIAQFVPLCAQRCMQSFISANFDADVCGSSSSLPCLCRKTGKSGFTIGEGGVQCIIAESNRKICLGNDASGRSPDLQQPRHTNTQMLIMSQQIKLC